MFGWLKLNTYEWIWRWLCEVQNCQVKIDSELQSAWECFGVSAFVCYVAIDLCICMEKVRDHMHSRFLSSSLLAL